MGSCRFCFFGRMAVNARARAKQWEDQKLHCLAAPYHKIATEYEAMTVGASRCTCGEPTVMRWKPERKKIDPEVDYLEPL